MPFSTVARRGKRGESGNGAMPEEVGLINRVASRDRAAFESLYRRYYPRLHRFIDRVTRRPQMVDEILNDTMFVVWRKAATFNQRSKVSTWIFGIALRRALKALAGIDEPVAFEADDSPDLRSSNPDTLVAQAETKARIVQAMGALSPDHRAVIELTYFEGYSCAEVAEIMRCPVNTTKTRMFHARRRLRMLLPSDMGDGE